MNTKKIALLSLFIAFLSLGSFASVYAENGASVNANISGEIKLDRIKMEEKRKEMTETRKENQDEMKNKMEERRENMKENLQQFRERFRDLMKKRIHWGVEMMTKRFNSAVERLEKLTVRIESRIEKLKDGGDDTTEAEKFVADAKVKISLAKEDIAKLPASINVVIDASVDSTNSTSTPPKPDKGAFDEARKLAQKIKEELKDAHGLLVEAVKSMKELHVDAELEAETTVTP